MTVREPLVIEPHTLSKVLEQSLKSHRSVYIAATTGWGKTTAVRHHFRGTPHTYASLWEEDALEKAEQEDTGLTILDDCHLLINRPELQKGPLLLLRNAPAGSSAILLGRAPIPEFLLPFQLSGVMNVLDSDALALGTGDTAKLAEHLGLELSPEDVVRLCRESLGIP